MVNDSTTVAGKLSDFFSNIGTPASYLAWKASVPAPTTPPAPVAPQTADALNNWTPADMYAGTAAAFNDWKTQSITYTPEPAPPEPPKDNTYLYLAAFLGVISLLVLVKR